MWVVWSLCDRTPLQSHTLRGLFSRQVEDVLMHMLD